MALPLNSQTASDAPSVRIFRFGAIVAGVLSFIGLYILLALLMLFALALLSEHIASDWLYGSFKFLGVASWIIPGFVAARVAGRAGWLHGAATGLVVGLLVLMSLTFTFSWEGTLHEALRASMFKPFFLAAGLCTLGGILGDLLARRDAARAG